MNASAPWLGEVAAGIVAAELQDRRESEMPQRLAHVFRRLHDILTPLVGELGYAAVLKRAVWLAARGADAQGFPAEAALAETDFSALIEKAGTGRAVRWTEEIVHHALSLLMSFLGERLTLRILERAFPQTAKIAKEGPK